MNRIMIDLETLGTTGGSVIATIGAVRFNQHEITDRIYLRLNIPDQQCQGLRLDAETVLWWFTKSREAQSELTNPDRLLGGEALEKLSEWMLSAGKVDELWGNGADFDCILLAALYKAYAAKVPWRYSKHRCYRTIAARAPTVSIARTGTHHNALADAESQAVHLLRIERCIANPQLHEDTP